MMGKRPTSFTRRSPCSRPYRWCASSVDANADGSVWVAERDHPDVSQSTNRIFKVSSSGKILQSVSLEWSPFCVRSDHSDGSVWVTGIGVSKPVTQRVLDSIERRTGKLPIGKRFRDSMTRVRLFPKTAKFDEGGRLLFTLPQGGHTLEIDPSDHSLWLATRANGIYHYSRAGKKLGYFSGVSADQKYIAIVPQKGEAASALPATR